MTGIWQCLCCTGDHTCNDVETAIVRSNVLDERTNSVFAENDKLDLDEQASGVHLFSEGEDTFATATSIVSPKPSKDADGWFSVDVNLLRGESPGFVLDIGYRPPLRVNSVQASTDQQNSQNLGSGISPGDFLSAVNGVSEDVVAMLKTLHTGGALTLELRHSIEFPVRGLRKEGQHKLGIDVDFHATSRSLIVKKVNPGGEVEIRNRTVAEDLRIRPLDHIVAVNGRVGESRLLLQV
eukprot:CAMPEP_0206468486 /NCGR_PEP_ID=MMETSP0324_2-20121206/29657_1 /ASSEMBLY_ACC=CAM_ASM_000836 /TAXON_ID=2866 /ORGANISM="Crypthecodinium cohnii, Strain Seligo" /LENGTH=237 /DNA_ID=CAMNT_0053941951 /DNA_START=337 /DNA_END=1046 /DNA_ORIENTATION=-